MFDIILNVFRSLKDWKKALLFTFISYVVLFLGIAVVIVFIRRGFSKTLSILAGLGTTYAFLLLVVMIVAWILFRKRLITE